MSSRENTTFPRGASFCETPCGNCGLSELEPRDQARGRLIVGGLLRGRSPEWVIDTFTSDPYTTADLLQQAGADIFSDSPVTAAALQTARTIAQGDCPQVHMPTATNE